MRTIFAVICLALLFTLPVHAQENILAARDLYTGANYEDALAVLGRLDSPGSEPPDRLAINQYRAFCLLALGRTAEAERAIEAVVSADLLFHPAEADASPRLRSAFASVRQRILPAIVQQEYARAKAAFERQDFATAIVEFDRVLQALGDADLGDAAGRPPLADLRTLATGFRDLSARAAAPPPAPEPAPQAAPELAALAPAPLKLFYNSADIGVVQPVDRAPDPPPVSARDHLSGFRRPGGDHQRSRRRRVSHHAGVDQPSIRLDCDQRGQGVEIRAGDGWRHARQIPQDHQHFAQARQLERASYLVTGPPLAHAAGPMPRQRCG